MSFKFSGGILLLFATCYSKPRLNRLTDDKKANTEVWNYIWKHHYKANRGPDYRYKIYYLTKAVFLLFNSLQTLKLNKNSQTDLLDNQLKLMMPIFLGAIEYYMTFMFSNNMLCAKQKLADSLRRELIEACVYKKISFYEKFGAAQVRDAIDELPDLFYNRVCGYYDQAVNTGVLISMAVLKMLYVVFDFHNGTFHKDFFTAKHHAEHQYFLLYSLAGLCTAPIARYSIQNLLKPAMHDMSNSRSYAKEQIDQALNYNIHLINSEATENEEVVHLLNLYKEADQKQLYFKYAHKNMLLFIACPLIAVVVLIRLPMYLLANDRAQEAKNILLELQINGIIANIAREYFINREKERADILKIKRLLSFVFSSKKPNKCIKNNFVSKEGQLQINLSEQYKHPKDTVLEQLEHLIERK